MRTRWNAGIAVLEAGEVSIVSSTVGSKRSTGWRRRSSGRILLDVLPVLVKRGRRRSCAARRAPAPGSSMLPASIAPSAAPAPTTVWISSMKTIRLSAFSVISSITPCRRSSDSPRYFVPAIIPAMSSATKRLPASVRARRRSARSLGHSLHYRGLADAGVAEQHRVVLRAARGRASQLSARSDRPGRSRDRAFPGGPPPWRPRPYSSSVFVVLAGRPPASPLSTPRMTAPRRFVCRIAERPQQLARLCLGVLGQGQQHAIRLRTTCRSDATPLRRPR